MIYETVPISFGGKNNAKLTLFVPQLLKKGPVMRRPTVLITPGGGYKAVSPREDECIAFQFLTYGYNAAVLSYSVKEDAQFPQPLCEEALAMAYLKENAQRYHIDPDRIFTCGFSAGAHLALSLGVFWDTDWLSEKVGKDKELLRPAAQILCYPVVSTEPELLHLGSTAAMLGREDTPQRRELVSLEKHVSPNTPPTFLWATLKDRVVPCENSLVLASALQKQGVPVEFHLYGWGGHGLSVANRITQVRNEQKLPIKSHINPHVATWLPLCREWLEEIVGVEILPPEED